MAGRSQEKEAAVLLGMEIEFSAAGMSLAFIGRTGLMLCRPYQAASFDDPWGLLQFPTSSPQSSRQGEGKEGNEVRTFPFKSPTQNLHTLLPLQSSDQSSFRGPYLAAREAGNSFFILGNHGH